MGRGHEAAAEGSGRGTQEDAQQEAVDGMGAVAGSVPRLEVCQQDGRRSCEEDAQQEAVDGMGAVAASVCPDAC